MPITPKEAAAKKLQSDKQSAQQIMGELTELLDDLLADGQRDWLYDPIALQIPPTICRDIADAIARIYRQRGWQVTITSLGIRPVANAKNESDSRLEPLMLGFS